MSYQLKSKSQESSMRLLIFISLLAAYSCLDEDALQILEEKMLVKIRDLYRKHRVLEKENSRIIQGIEF